MNNIIFVLIIMASLASPLAQAQDFDSYTGSLPNPSVTVNEREVNIIIDAYPEDLIIVERDTGVTTFLPTDGPSVIFESYDEFKSSGLPIVAHVFYRKCICSFYNNLPDIIIDQVADLASGVGFYWNKAASQTRLDSALTSFQQTSLAADPFVKLGLKYVNDIILVEEDNDNNAYTGSPSGYNSLDNIVYINSNDLTQYGDVVIFHELMQAGLFNGLAEGYISPVDFEKLRNMDERYFSRLGMSYVNAPRANTAIADQLAVLTAFKAFAIGYTYKVFSQYDGNFLELAGLDASNIINSAHYYNSVFLREFKINKFLSDVEENVKVLTIRAPYSLRVDVHLIGNPITSNQADIDYFINMFMNETSLVNRDINIVTRKIRTSAQGSEANDNYGEVLASADFNNDGFLDLAIGIPDGNVDSKNNAGLVNVIYGGVNGLAKINKQVWHQNIGRIAGGAESGDRFGASLAAGDFDNDGFADLAVGVPGEALGSTSKAGMVNIIYGGHQGLSDSRNKAWSQDSGTIKGGAEANDNFGASLAAGDFDNDGFVDLAVGVPGEALGSKLKAGMVNIIYGSSSGLTDSGNQHWHQDIGSIAGGAEAGDGFGTSLAVGDFDENGHADLVVGVPGESIGSKSKAGMVNIIYGYGYGLSDRGNQGWSQDSASIAGGAEAGDGFGSSVAAGDFDQDGVDDLAVGVPGESIGTLSGAGVVNVIYGSRSGLVSNGNRTWSQNSGSIAGGSEVGDKFGASLAAGDFDNDGFVDLAVGVPGEAIGSISNAGMVNIIHGSLSGLTDTGNRGWSQNSGSIRSGAEAGDRFGASVVTGDFDNDGFVDVAVGVPTEDVGSIVNAGAVNAVYGSESGLSATGNKIWYR